MRLTTVLTVVLALAACKTRDPDRAGLLDEEDGEVEGTPTGLQLADQPATGGAWDIDCKTASGGERFHVEVDGAVSATDEAQPLVVSITRFVGDEQHAVVTGDRGRGAASEGGPLFIGFQSGVLTAERGAGGALAGVLTLSRDQKARALDVTCTLAKATR